MTVTSADVVSAYPEAFSGFRGRGKDPDFLLPVGPGWWPILRDLLRRLKALDEERADGETAQIFQIKEKFGGLRVYTFQYFPGYSEAMTEAEKQSYRVCEECGAPAGRYSDGWILTLCEEHARVRWHERVLTRRTSQTWERCWTPENKTNSYTDYEND